MARYMRTAHEANKTAHRLFNMVAKQGLESSENIEFNRQVARDIAHLVNYGIRCSPRPVQGTVRLNAVREAVKDLPVRVSMVKETDPDTGKEFNKLVVD